MKQYENVVLVTGGAGFIGSAFLRMLVPKYSTWYFINLDALTYAGDLNKVESIADYENYVFVYGSICDRLLVESLFEKYRVNIVVNFAAESHVDNSIKDAKSFIETNIKGTQVLLDVAKNNWVINETKKHQSHNKFLQISTDEVYGSLTLEDDPMTEDANFAPNNPYSASKASAELLARSYYKTFGLPIIITRSSNNFGPFQNSEKFIPTIIRSALLNQDIPIYGKGDNIRDWIYVYENIEAINLILIDGIIGEIYNIGCGNEKTNLDIALLILKLIPNSKSRINNTHDRLGHDFRYALNINKLSNIGFKNKGKFINELAQTIEFYRKLTNEYNTK